MSGALDCISDWIWKFEVGATYDDGVLEQSSGDWRSSEVDVASCCTPQHPLEGELAVQVDDSGDEAAQRNNFSMVANVGICGFLVVT